MKCLHKKIKSWKGGNRENMYKNNESGSEVHNEDVEYEQGPLPLSEFEKAIEDMQNGSLRID